MASTDVIILAASPVASDGFNKSKSKSKFLTSPAVAVQASADASSSKKQQVKMELTAKVIGTKQQLKPRFAVELDGLNCFETLVPR